jgi:hypothetical protein
MAPNKRYEHWQLIGQYDRQQTAYIWLLERLLICAMTQHTGTTKRATYVGLRLHTKVGYKTMFKVAAGIVVGLIAFCTGPLGWAALALAALCWAALVISFKATVLLLRVAFMLAKLAARSLWAVPVLVGRALVAVAVVSLATRALGRR